MRWGALRSGYNDLVLPMASGWFLTRELRNQEMTKRKSNRAMMEFAVKSGWKISSTGLRRP